MDIADPMRSLVPSLDSAVLEVLARSEAPLTAATIARLSRRGTRAGQWPVLQRLRDDGLITAEPAGPSTLYRLNRDHVLAPAIVVAADARRETLRRIRAAVAGLRFEIVHARLFGSFARGDGGSESDIDLLLVVEDQFDRDDPSWIESLERLEDSVLAWTGNRLDLLVFSVAEISLARRASEPIVESWRSEGIVLAGDLAVVDE